MSKQGGIHLKKGTVKWIFIGLGAVLAVLVLFLLVLDAYGTKERRVRSNRFGYLITYDETRYDFETVRLDERPTYMERVFFKNSPYGNYVSVSGVDASADIDEIITTFQADGSYKFEEQTDATFGVGNYSARKFSYTDTSGDTAVRVDYYFMPERGLLVTAAYDASHKKELAKILASLEFE